MEVKGMFLPGFVDSVLKSYDQGDVDVHLVFWAANGLTPLNAMTLGIFDGEYLDDLVNYINNNGEAITIYPKCRITIFPRNKGERLRENIRRCIRLNEEIVKSRFIYFIEDGMYDPSFFEILKDEVEKIEDVKFTEKIFFPAYCYNIESNKPDDFLLYYHTEFRRILERFFCQEIHNEKYIKYEYLTNASSYLSIIAPKGLINFGVSLYFDVLIDQVSHYYFENKIERLSEKMSRWNSNWEYYMAYFNKVHLIDENHLRKNAHPKFILEAMSNADKSILNDFKTKLIEVAPIMKSVIFDLLRIYDIGIDGPLFWEKCQNEIDNTLQFIEESIN